MKVQQNAIKLQNKIIQGLNDVMQASGSIEASSAGFFLMGNALYESGNIDYAQKYYTKGAELQRQVGESEYVTIAKLIKIYAEQGKVDLVRENLKILATEYNHIETKPAVSKEIKEAFKNHYNFQGNFKIQLNQVITQCQEWLDLNNNNILSQPSIRQNQITLSDKIKKDLEDVLNYRPSQSPVVVLSNQGRNISTISSELTAKLKELTVKITNLEQNTDEQLTQLKQDIDKKPSQAELDNFKSIASKQMDNLSIKLQTEALTLKDMILRVDAKAATVEDVEWVNAQLEKTDASRLEDTQQIIILKNIFYKLEQTIGLSTEEMLQLQHTVESKTKALETKIVKIYEILETKANQDDLEYVNSELEKVSSTSYDDAQKIVKIDQLLQIISYKVEAQEDKILDFISYINKTLNDNTASISKLFSKVSQSEPSELTEEYLLEFSSEIKKHAQLIIDLDNDIKRVSNNKESPHHVGDNYVANDNNNEELLSYITKLMDECQNQMLQNIQQIITTTTDQQVAVILKSEITKIREELTGEIQNINDALILTEIYKKAQLSKDFTNLTGNDAIYAKAFVSGMRNYIDVYRIASKEFFTVEEKQLIPEIVSDLLKAIPGIGNTLGTVDKYVNKLYSIKDSETKAQIIKKLKFIDSNFVLQDLELYTAEVALTMIRNKSVAEALNEQQQNIGFVNQITEKVNQVQKEFDSKMDLLKQEIIGVDAVNDEHLKEISELAWEHADIFMEALVRRDGEDLPKSLPEFIAIEVFKEAQNLQIANIQEIQNNPNIVANQLRSEIYRIGDDEESKQNDYQPKQITQTKSKGSKCNVFSVTTTKYDNQLLNNPDLLNELLSKPTNIYNFNKILDLSLGLSSSLIDEAVQSHNVDLLLGGLMSLDSSEY